MKTICPNCGHSPIPAGAAECPSCGEPFDFLQTHKKAQKKFIDKRDSDEGEMTTFGGGLTGEVTAHPWPAATALFLGAVAFFLRASGMFGPADPQWVFGVVLLDIIGAAVLVINLGPAKLLAQIVAGAQLAAALYLARGDFRSLVSAAFIAHSALCVTMVLGEPGPIRRYLSLGFGLCTAGLAAFGVITHADARLPVTEQNVELGADDLGVHLSLPQGFTQVTPAEAAGILTIPPNSLVSGSLAFGQPKIGRIGVVTVATFDEQKAQLVSSCHAYHRAIGGRGEPETVSHDAPVALGSPTIVLRLRTSSGNGLVACGKKKDGRIVALAVVQRGASDATADALFDVVGSGLSLK